MKKYFKLDILSSVNHIFQGEVYSLIAPGQAGYLGVLAHHAPLIASLVPGKIIFEEVSGKRTIIQSERNGFLDVHNNRVIILLE
ncbi:MAG: F0F1 ATP synthase subunit epsilon [Candidatus Omnitrophica bacterium]|nr:F0F1 ATP synthase subunit epsilon [Candidatus Omnitrophota bacterium]